jgi:DNA-binding response OmpR family regulator
MPLTGHRILLVEDEFLIALEVERTLQAAHGEVVGRAANVARAMKLADTPNLSAAILDFRLQFGNSFPVASKLRADGVPFIFYTATTIPELPAAWPGVPIVMKPASPVRLVSVLVSLVKLSRPVDRSRVA